MDHVTSAGVKITCWPTEILLTALVMTLGVALMHSLAPKWEGYGNTCSKDEVNR